MMTNHVNKYAMTELAGSAGDTPQEPALPYVATSIEKQLAYAGESMDRIWRALSRAIPPVPTTAAMPVEDEPDGTLLGALKVLESRLTRLTVSLHEAAAQLDRAV